MSSEEETKTPQEETEGTDHSEKADFFFPPTNEKQLKKIKFQNKCNTSGTKT